MSTSQGSDMDPFIDPISVNSFTTGTSAPTPSPPLSSLFQPQSNSSHGTNSMDILAAVFFAVAGTWLVIAMCYSGMVLLFLRMRARGQLENLYDEEFGRIYLCGSHRYYIPLGCLFRRYLIQMQNQSGSRRRRTMRYVSTRERRQAMEVLLLNNEEEDDDEENDTRPTLEVDIETGNDVNADADSAEGPLCSICLGDYEPQDHVLVSKTCPHEFHQDCILDWLQRPGNVECPCCRSVMVSEEDVWKTVHEIRKERKRQHRTVQRNGISRKTSVETQELEATESSDVTDVDEVIAPSTLEEPPVNPPELDDDHPSVDSAGTDEAHGSHLEL